MTTKSESKDELKITHKKFATQCFNSGWDYLDKSSLTEEEERTMLNLAHASAFHWSKIGSARNFGIGDWQISRCYTKINDGISALKYAQSSYHHIIDNKIEDLYVSAYEGLARAYAFLRDYENAKKFIAQAEKELKKVTKKEDRAVFEPQLKDTKSMIT